MGRVCLSAYYMTGTLDHNMLLQSTKAYKNSAKDQKMMHCAELWYNCSMAYKFLENYLMALTGLIMDPNLKSLEQTLNLCDVLDYINSLLQKLNDAKQLSSPTSSSLPTIDSLASSLASVELDPSYEIERANVNRLTEGLNEGKAVTAVNNLSKEVEHPEEITGESIKHAKEAVALDVQDGISWHALGNACLPVYFLTGTWHHDMLVQSVKANKNAVKNGKMKRSAEFCYNCSMMYKFLENCWMALTGFESAGLIMDPSLQSLKQSLNLCDVLDNINSLLQHNQSK